MGYMKCGDGVCAANYLSPAFCTTADKYGDAVRELTEHYKTVHRVSMSREDIVRYIKGFNRYPENDLYFWERERESDAPA